jgi:hypothetical protein
MFPTILQARLAQRFTFGALQGTGISIMIINQVPTGESGNASVHVQQSLLLKSTSGTDQTFTRS